MINQANRRPGHATCLSAIRSKPFAPIFTFQKSQLSGSTNRLYPHSILYRLTYQTATKVCFRPVFFSASGDFFSKSAQKVTDHAIHTRNVPEIGKSSQKNNILPKDMHNPAKYRKIFLDDKAINLVKSVKSVDSGFPARTVSMVFG